VCEFIGLSSHPFKVNLYLVKGTVYKISKNETKIISKQKCPKFCCLQIRINNTRDQKPNQNTKFNIQVKFFISNSS